MFKDIRYALITDSNVEKLYGESLCNQLCAEGYDVSLISFPAGEEYKTRKTKQQIEDAMFEKKMGRDSTVIALGGGVVTDLAGFVAATYCRGIPLILVPTTLLAMVDASIGGKTGVNTPAGKNLIGAFYPAEQIVIDLSYLKTLPEKEIKNGYAEILKMGLILEKDLFDKELEEKISLAIALKRQVIEEDFRESGKRRILNFGHTIGHAMEKVLKYQIAHGEAVGAGMRVESYLSMKLGYLKQQEFEFIENLLKEYPVPQLDIDRLCQAMEMDKKTKQGAPHFVILNAIGKVQDCRAVSKDKIEEAYGYFSH